MEDTLTFAHSQWLYLLLLAIPLVIIKVLTAKASREGLEKVTSPRLREHLVTARRPLGDWGRFALQLVGLALLTVALARPQKGFVEEVTRVEGRNIVIGMDTSRSMLAEDITRGGRTSRLTQAKLAAIDLIDSLPGDRIGLIAFAGTAFMQAPMTSDHQAVTETVEQLNTFVIQRGGTNLAAAISLARDRLGEVDAARNALILFTDGDDLEGTALKEAEKAAEQGITIITVGVGSPNPTIVPDPEARGSKQFIKDDSGELVKSSMDAESLEKIAKAANGRFINLQSGLMNQQLVNNVLSNISYSSSEDKLKRTPRERYFIPMALGLACIAAAYIGTLWGSRPHAKSTFAAIALLFLTLQQNSHAGFADTAYDAYRQGDYEAAQTRFSEAKEAVKDTQLQNELAFGSGAAAYQSGDYATAIESFSQALVSPTPALQERAHYNLGNTLFRRGEKMWKDTENGGVKKLAEVISEWEDAAGHFRSALDLHAKNDDAKTNLEITETLLEQLKKFQQEQQKQEQEQEEKKDEQEKKEEQEKEESEEQQKEEGSENEEEQDSGEEEQEKPEEGEEKPQEGENGEEETEPNEGESGQPGDKQPGEEGEEQETPMPDEEAEDPDDEVDEKTGYSKNQARENLEKLSDEQRDLGLLRRRRAQQKNKRYYKDW